MLRHLGCDPRDALYYERASHQPVAIDVLVANIHEVLLAETALCLDVGCQRFHGDVSPLARDDFLPNSHERQSLRAYGFQGNLG
jgi:hypothetical protein